MLSLGFGVFTEFGERYGYRVDSREQQEIIMVCFVIIIVTGLVYFSTKNKPSSIAKIAKAPIKKQINNKMETEISEYIRIIKGLGDEELGLALLSALTLRKHILNSSGIDLMDPVIALQKNPDTIISLSKKHEELTAKKQPHLTVPFTIWVHTLRSINNPVIRTLGREMWKELSRGFKHIEAKKESYKIIYGNEPISELAGQYPIGLSPNDIKKKTETSSEHLSSLEREKKLLEYTQLHKKGLITKDALTKLQVDLLSKKSEGN